MADAAEPAAAPERQPVQVPRSHTTADIEAALAQRRSYPGGNDGEGKEDRRPEEIPFEEIKQRAQVHMLATACTEWDDTEHCYKFLPVCGTTPQRLGEMGIGLQLYFQFLAQMGSVFLVMTILTFPLLICASIGDMMESEDATAIFGKLSIGNLGTCGTAQSLCPTTAAVQERKLHPNLVWKIRELTPIFGTMDGVAMLVFMLYALFFGKYWIPREMKIRDELVVTPSDYTLRILHLPRKLKDPALHKRYAELLREHFEEILAERCGVGGESLIQEISIARDHNGALYNRLQQGEHAMRKHNYDVLLLKLEDEKKKQGLQKSLDRTNRSIAKLHKALGDDAAIQDEDREVCGAFVTFKKADHMEAIMHQYRFAKSVCFRCCQDKALRFHEKQISVIRASEPTDIYWENMDFWHWWRKLRICTTCIVTIVILLVSLALLVACKSLGIGSQGTTPASNFWVMQSVTASDCFTLCDWTAYTDSRCLAPGSQGISASIAAVWDSTGLIDNSSWTSCSQGSWSSPSCSTGASGGSWIGIQLTSAQRLGCIRFKQRDGRALSAVSLYACNASNMDNASSATLASWSPQDHCIGLQDLAPSTKADTSNPSVASSSKQLVSMDTSCRRSVSYEAAQRALDTGIAQLKSANSGLSDSEARSQESQANPTLHCYCKQQEKIVGKVQFRSPPYSGLQSKQLCEQWIWHQSLASGLLVGSVAVVCLLNQVLVLIFTYLVTWERHDTMTSQNTSQFIKLLFCQFLNTALLILLVNATDYGLLDNVWIVKVLQFLNGNYSDFDSDWYAAVGSGLTLTILMQVFTVTVPQLVMAYCVNPVVIWFYRRGVVTQKALNSVYMLPEWYLSNRIAETTSTIFVIVMYSGGMPFLNVVGCLYCCLAYWIDKWALLKGSRQPPAYKADMLRHSAALFPVAAFFHTVIALWAFGNQNIFPSGFSGLKEFFGGLIDMDEVKYQAIMDEFTVADTAGRGDLFDDFCWARALDITRWSCWLLCCFFLVFVVYWILELLLVLFLRPLVTPLIIAIRGTFSRFTFETEGEGLRFSEAVPTMLDKNMIPSYLPHLNPRYAMLMGYVKPGDAEIKDALAEHQARKDQGKESTSV
mmetsp:Transcript_77143/g.218305  ORF Transcript_77143/g.218305 Transcript_77143/m.218305 type:complete len:1105 (-) Transcript_77143:145-3459(-)